MKRSFFARFAPAIMLVVIGLLPVAVVAALLALATNRNDVQEWLPESFQETQDYKAFQRHFKKETFILVSWEGCTLDDVRLDTLSGWLSPQAKGASEDSKHFVEVVTGRALLTQLTTPPANLSEDEAIARLQGSLIGRDRQTCAVLMLSDEGKANPRAAVAAVYATLEDKCGIPRNQIYMGGPPVDNVAIDLEGERNLLTLMLTCAAVGFSLTYWCLRHLGLTILVFLGGAYSAVLSLALVKAMGGSMNAVLLTMPAVVYTAGLACAIHLVNYYRHLRAQHGRVGAAERGLAAAWIPCALSAGTTTLGLFSLCTSELVPIRKFGFYTGVGVMASIGLLFLYLPAALQLWPPALPGEKPGGPSGSNSLGVAHRRRMRWLAGKIIARPAWIFAGFLIATAVFGSGLLRARTTVNLMSLFPPDAEIIRSYHWLEDRIGPLVPMEVVLRIDPNKTSLTFLERMELIGRLQKGIETIEEVGSTMSAMTFAPRIERSNRGKVGRMFLPDKAYRKLINGRLVKHRDEFIAGDYLAVDQATGEELWRINVRVAALKDIDYGVFIGNIKERVDPAIEDARREGARGIAGVTYTGLTPVVYRAERVLLNGLIESFFVAFVMIGSIMSFVFRDLRAGFYTMLPNVWPMAVVFGLMGWLNIALDIGTMMTASVAMGVCVDDTVHFTNWFRRATRIGADKREAVVMAFENSAGAIYQSTLIVSLGLATFALSSFVPTRRFGFLMGALLACGLVADLVLSPAMLAGPVGRFFTKDIRPDPEPSPEPAGVPDEATPTH